MTNVVSLNNVDHHDLAVTLGYGAAFGDAVNQTLVFPNEFEDAQRDYPIIFRHDESGAFQAVVLLGFDRDENLFLQEQEWRASYVPAVHQRGPFLIGMGGQGAAQRDPIIQVDLDHPRIGGKGATPVFLPHGGNSPYLDHIVRVLGVIHDGMMATAPMFAAFAELDLIEPVLLKVSLDETKTYQVPDCYTIGAERLATLTAAELEQLHRPGFLRLAFFVAASLGNVGRLIALKNARR
jgi:hypothetical protein